MRSKMVWILSALILVGLSVGGCTKRKNRFIVTSETSSDPADLAPKLTSVTPERSAGDVSPGTEIRAVFDRAIDPGTVDSESVRIEGPAGPVAVTIEVTDTQAGEDRQIVVRPLRGLLMLADYRVTLTTAIATPQGDPLLDDQVWSFRTRDGRFDAAVDVGTGLGEELAPAIAMDGEGHALALWRAREPGTQGMESRLYASRLDLGADWEAPTLLEGYPELDTRSAQVDVNASGFGLAIWRRNLASEQYPLYGSFYRPGEGWSTPEPVGADTTLVSADGVRVDTQGNALAIWRAGLDLLARRWDAESESWEDPVLLQDDGETIEGVRVASNGSGVTIAAWRVADGLLASRFDPAAGSWSPAETISSSVGLVYSDPRVAVDGAGAALVTWEQAEMGDDPSTVWAARCDESGAWSAAESIEQEDLFAGSHDLAMNRAGRAIVVWTQARTEQPLAIFANEYVPGEGWRGATPAAVDDGFGSLVEPSIAVDTEDGAVLAFRRELDANFSDVCVVRSTQGRWGVVQAVEHVYEETRHALATVDRQGNALVFWQQEEGRRWDLYAARGVKDAGWLPAEPIDIGLRDEVVFDQDGSGRLTLLWSSRGDEVEADALLRGSAFH